MAAEKLTKKDWLYIAGAFASLVALWFLFFWKRGGGVILPPADAGGGTTDIPGTAGDVNSNFPSQYSYNIQPLLPEGVGTAPGETPAGLCGCASPSAYGCAGASMLDTGNAYTTLKDLLDYYQTTSPNFVSNYSALAAPYFGYQYGGTGQVSVT